MRDATRPFFRPLSVGLIVAGIVACTPTSDISVNPQAAGIGEIEPVLVATTRAYADGEYQVDRVEALNFTSYDVSIPPIRELGQVSPNRSMRRAADPHRHFTVTRAEELDGPPAFRRALRDMVNDRPVGEREVMVFVHGYNSEYPDGLYRTAQIRHDFDIPGVAVHFAWPSAGRVLGYAYDRDSALFSRDGLEELLEQISSARHGIVIVSHSLGASLTMEALRQLSIAGRQDVLRQIVGVVLISPDIDVQVFRQQAQRIDPLPENFVIFTSQRDRALRFSSALTLNRPRLGSIGEADDVADFEITIIDVSNFTGGDNDTLNHFTTVSSPAMVELLRDLAQVNLHLAPENSVEEELLNLPAMVMAIRSATRFVIDPDE